MALPAWLSQWFDGKDETAFADSRLSRWQEWVQPIHPDNPVGDDVAYDDDFETIKSELSQLSGINAAAITEAAERLLKTGAKDLRVAVYFAYGNLRQNGLDGFSDGLELICSLLQTYPIDIWPKKPAQRKNAVAWLAGEKVLDALAVTDFSNREACTRMLSALALLYRLSSEWEEAFRPSLSPIFQSCESLLAEQKYPSPQSGSATESAEPPPAAETVAAPQKDSAIAALTPAASISSSKMLLDQTRVIAAYLRQQDSGYWAAYKMVRAVRWGSVNSPPPAADDQTRLKPPRADLQVTLKRLLNEKQWLDLLERVEVAFLEGANHFWLDLQYYAWQGQKALGGLYAEQADSALGELLLLLNRCPEIYGMSFENGSRFVSDSVAEWLQNQAILQTGGKSEAQSAAEFKTETDTDKPDWEQEANRLADDNGLEAAMSWLDNHPLLQTGQAACHKLLLMAKLAEKQQKSDWSVYLLEQAAAMLQEASVISWNRDFAFELYAMQYRLLYAKSKRKDMQLQLAEIQAQIEQLKKTLMQVDAVRSLHLFH